MDSNLLVRFLRTFLNTFWSIIYFPFTSSGGLPWPSSNWCVGLLTVLIQSLHFYAFKIYSQCSRFHYLQFGEALIVALKDLPNIFRILCKRNLGKSDFFHSSLNEMQSLWFLDFCFYNISSCLALSFSLSPTRRSSALSLSLYPYSIPLIYIFSSCFSRFLFSWKMFPNSSLFHFLNFILMNFNLC